jgi:hypothetical protein
MQQEWDALSSGEQTAALLVVFWLLLSMFLAGFLHVSWDLAFGAPFGLVVGGLAVLYVVAWTLKKLHR